MWGLFDDFFIVEVDEKGRWYYWLNCNINVDKFRFCMEM